MKSRTIPLLAAALAAPARASVKFEIDTATCDGDPFYDLDVSITCDGDNAPDCTFGDDATIEGTVEALESFDDLDVYLKACLWGYCPEDSIQNTGTLCNNWLTPTDNITCGDAGTYEVYSVGEIPTSDVPHSWSWMVKVVIDFEPECEASGSSSGSDGSGGSGGSYQMSPGVTYSMMGALIGTAFGAWYAKKKKLICSDDEDGERAGDFIEMGCPGGVV